MAGRNNCWLFVYNVVRLRHRSDICLLAYHTGVLKKGYSLNITPRVYYVMKASLESEAIIDFINSHKRELREKLAVDDAETARNYIITHRDEVKEWLFSTEDISSSYVEFLEQQYEKKILEMKERYERIIEELLEENERLNTLLNSGIMFKVIWSGERGNVG